MFKENVFIKSIVRGGNNRFQNCWFNGSHTPQCSNKVTYSIGGYYNVDYGMHTHFPLRYKCGYIKHYYTKSFDEWIKKSSRGWPDGTATLATSNFMICESAQTSIDNMEEGFFIHPSEYGYLGERMTKLLDEYDVFQIKNTNKQIYAVTAQLISLMKHSTNHTFIITEECPGHIDDTLFAIYMEYGFRTGNRVVYAKNQNEVWLAFLRYSQKENYYIVDLK